MRYLGSDFKLSLGAWRLRVAFALEDDEPEAATPEPQPQPRRTTPTAASVRRSCSAARNRRTSTHRS